MIRESLLARLNNLADHHYGLFTEFTKSISACSSMEDIGECLKTYLTKDLGVDFYRISAGYYDKWVQFEYQNGECNHIEAKKPQLLEFEDTFYSRNSKPDVLSSFIIDEASQQSLESKLEIGDTAIIWCLKIDDIREVVVLCRPNIDGSNNPRFLSHLKLFSNAVERKTRSIIFFNELRERRKGLNGTFTQISEKRLEIDAIMRYQDEIMRQQILDMNSISKEINGMNIPSPDPGVDFEYNNLMGLTKLVSKLDAEEVSKTILPLIKKALDSENGERFSKILDELDRQLVLKSSIKRTG